MTDPQPPAQPNVTILPLPQRGVYGKTFGNGGAVGTLRM